MTKKEYVNIIIAEYNFNRKPFLAALSGCNREQRRELRKSFYCLASFIEADDRESDGYLWAALTLCDDIAAIAGFNAAQKAKLQQRMGMFPVPTIGNPVTRRAYDAQPSIANMKPVGCTFDEMMDLVEEQAERAIERAYHC